MDHAERTECLPGRGRRSLPREKEMTMPDSRDVPYDVFLNHSARDKVAVRASSLSASTGDSIRLGIGERHSGEPKAPWGPSERGRSSHWAGARCRSLRLRTGANSPATLSMNIA